MPAYDFRCRECDTQFEVRRSISETIGSPSCPQGHEQVSRVWSGIAVTGLGGGVGTMPAPPAPAGGCCGGGCCG